MEFVKPGGWLANLLQGLKNLRILSYLNSFPSYLWCCRSCTHSTQSLIVKVVSRQVGSKVKGLLRFVSEDWSEETSLNHVRLFSTPWTVAYYTPGIFHGIFQARVLEWVVISFSRGSFQPRDRTRVSHIVGGCFTIWATREVTRLFI